MVNSSFFVDQGGTDYQALSESGTLLAQILAYVTAAQASASAATAAAASVPAAATANPTMAGAASPGAASTYSRGDHVHPTDTSRAAAASVPVAATTNPTVAGTASPGVASTYSRGDHVHPTDTSRAAVTYVDAQDATKASLTYVDAQDATKASLTYVDAQDATKAPLASPTFTGTPAAPTASFGNVTTQIATTAFLNANAVRLDSLGNIIGGSGAGTSLVTSPSNVLLGPNAGHNLGAGTGENVAIGNLAGQAISSGTQNTILGAEAGSSLTGDTGHTLLGYQAGTSLNSNTVTWNTFVGYAAGLLMTDGGSNVAVGRAALAHDLHGAFNTAVGHAALLLSTNNVGVCAFGDDAGGADISTGTSNWQGTGLTYWGSVSDVSCSYLGRITGKATVDGRNNSHAIGTLARIPKKDNVMVLGHGLTAVETTGNYYDGWRRVDITNNAAYTTGSPITAANLLSGLCVRAGTLGGAVTDNIDTAANFVAAGPGQYAEYASIERSFANLTSQTITLSGGTGVAFSGLGLGATVTAGALGKFRFNFDNTTPGSEAVTVYRVG